MITVESFPALESPPITEVVCGFLFEAIRNLSPLHQGLYWHTRYDEFPKVKILNVLTDSPGFVIGTGAGPIRSWLISQDEKYLLQLQSDRFYTNWRRADRNYPRFNDHDGQDGLLTRALAEFGRFHHFCSDKMRNEPKLKSIEVTKVDQFVQGEHWTDAADLGALLPSGQPLVQQAGIDESMIRVEGRRKLVNGYISWLLELRSPEDGTSRRHVYMSSTVRRSIDESADMVQARSLFFEANYELNRLFFSLIPESELSRFKHVV